VTDGLRLAAPGEVRLDLELPDRETALAFDGVEGALEVLERAPARPAVAHLEELREGGPRRVDLAAWRGQDVTLAIALGPGPREDRAHDRIRVAALRLGGEPLDLGSAARAAEEAGTLEPGSDGFEATPVAFVEVAARVPADRPELTFRAEPREPGRGDGVHLSVLVTASRAGERALWSGSTGAGRATLAPGPRKTTLVLRATGAAGSGVRVGRLRLDPASLTLLHDAGPWVYRNETALPRAQVVHRAEHAASDEAGLARLAAEDFDPAKTVLLYGEKGSGPFSAAEKGPDPFSSRARVTSHRRHEVVVEAEAAAPGWLVLADTFYPGWRATVDGRPAEIVRANHAFRSVRLPAGRHEVRFRYESAWFRWGLVLAGLGALALAAAAVARLAGRRGQV
jgi:hypothetical protein